MRLPAWSYRQLGAIFFRHIVLIRITFWRMKNALEKPRVHNVGAVQDSYRILIVIFALSRLQHRDNVPLYLSA